MTIHATLGGLLRGSFVYALGTMLPRLGVFLLLPVYTIGMGPSEFGVFSLMLSLAGLLTILFRLGIDGALLRFHFDVHEDRLGPLYWTAAAMTAAAAAVLGLAIVILGQGVFSAIFPGVAMFPTGALAVAAAAATAFQFLPATYFRAIERPALVLALGLALFAAGAVVSLWLVLGLRLGSTGGLLGQIGGGAVIGVVLAVLLPRLGRPSFDRGTARAFLSFGIPLVPHSLAAWVLNLSDRWLIGLFIGLSALAAQRAVGIYSLGYQLGQIVALVALALNTAWIPFFYARGGSEHAPGLLREMTTLSIGGLAVLAVAMAALAPDVVAVVAPASWGAESSEAGLVTPLVAFACLMQALYLMAVSPVFLQRRTQALPLLTLAAGACNVGMNMVLIPRIGILGAGWATIGGYGLLALLTIAYAGRTYPLRLDRARLVVLLGGAVLAMLAAAALPGGGPVPTVVIHLGVAAIFGAGVAPLLAGPWRRARHLVWAAGRPPTDAGTGQAAVDPVTTGG